MIIVGNRRQFHSTAGDRAAASALHSAADVRHSRRPKLYGIIGLFLGPAVLALFAVVLSIYRERLLAELSCDGLVS